jgi:hypothetical protein
LVDTEVGYNQSVKRRRSQNNLLAPAGRLSTQNPFLLSDNEDIAIIICKRVKVAIHKQVIWVTIVLLDRPSNADWKEYEEEVQTLKLCVEGR